MNQADVIQRLQKIFDDIFLDAPTLTPELTAKDVPEWTSLIHISLLVAVEQEFQVRFRVGEVEATRNVGEFADLIARRASEK
ncbi:MAG TPA: acyl carrier protein [Bryobacteraceae bacterium]|jgi:acyl carrier protein|nr:acyl carrier protein [Bryobacteraceae bacterium]